MDKYIVSLTSIPRRLDKSIFITIKELKKQSMISKILINIPYKYKKWKEYNLDKDFFKNDENVIIYRPSKDYGPATKLLGALEYIKDKKHIKYIITVDDDIIFNNGKVIETLIKNSEKHKDCAFTFGGIKLVNYPYKYGNGLKYNNIGYVDVPSGYMGVLYPCDKLRINNKIFNYMENLPDGIFNDDDAYFGIILSILKIPLISLKKISSIKLAKYCGGSAVSENTSKHRIINEMEIFQYAVKHNLLPNNSKIKVNL